MTVWVEIKKAVELSPEEDKQCRSLSYGTEGYMCEDLDNAYQNERRWRHRYSWVYLVREKEGMPIIAWSLLQPIYSSPRFTAQFFVDPAFRGRGIGTLLLHNANAFVNRKPVCYLDDDNEGFFAKNSHLYVEV